jgi:hypothetical protein
MARNDNVEIPATTWTQLTNANASSIRVQSVSATEMMLQATNGVTAPSTLLGAIVLAGGNVLAADMTIAQLWPGVAGANRVWAFANTASVASVSHADA